MTINVTVLITLAIVPLVLRILYVIYWSSKPFKTKSTKPVSTLIILGSGGHTAEMLNLLSVLQADRFYPRYYIAAATDNMSLQKASVFENQLAEKIGGEIVRTAQFLKIYRSREVGQSYVTSIGTTIFAVGHALLLMMKIKPQVILCNGPGTCIPLCVIAFFLKVMGIRWSSIFYVESIARVKRLSLSGIILYKLHMADQLFVQWPQLQRKYPRAHYVGRLIMQNSCVSPKSYEISIVTSPGPQSRKLQYEDHQGIGHIQKKMRSTPPGPRSSQDHQGTEHSQLSTNTANMERTATPRVQKSYNPETETTRLRRQHGLE